MQRLFVWVFILSNLINITKAQTARNPLLAPVAVIKAGEAFARETGTGILLGEKGKTLYFATAYHVIADPNKLSIQLYGQTSTLPGKVVNSNETLDLAILSCPMPDGYNIPNSYAITSVRADQECSFIGHPQSSYWDLNKRGVVKKLEYELDDRLFTLYPQGVTPGHSGGPILDEENQLIGMIREQTGANVICLQSRQVLRACLKWSIPTNLLTGVEKEEDQNISELDQAERQFYLQIANTAFKRKKWKQALDNYRKVFNLSPNSDIQARIDTCEKKLAKNYTYRELIKKGDLANDLEEAINYYKQAQELQNNPEIQKKIREKKSLLLSLVSSKEVDGGVKKFINYSDPDVGEMVFIEGGNYTIVHHDDSSKRQSQVISVPNFYLSKYEITQVQWKKIMGNNPSNHKCGSCPVENISWFEIMDYIKRLNINSRFTYRLPSESEWEYAAGGGSDNRTIYSGTNRKGLAYLYGNTKEAIDGYDSTTTVGSFKPNSIGLFDMIGNVSEMCEDIYYKNIERPTNGKAILEVKVKDHEDAVRFKVIKGGGFLHPPISVNQRSKLNIESSYISTGFRLARTP